MLRGLPIIHLMNTDSLYSDISMSIVKNVNFRQQADNYSWEWRAIKNNDQHYTVFDLDPHNATNTPTWALH